MKVPLLIYAILLLTACRGNKNKHDFRSKKEKDFYTDHKGYDYIRFPLIMPYDVMCIDVQEMNWRADLKGGTDFYFSINNVKNVAVINEIIMVYSISKHQVEVNKDPKKWFVIIPSKKLEIGFVNEVEFKAYLKTYGIHKIKWMDASQAYKKFEDTECLPWIKGCTE
jgi:preprotein translocase subunit SecF